MVIDPAEIEELFALDEHIVAIDEFHGRSEHSFTGRNRLTCSIGLG